MSEIFVRNEINRFRIFNVRNVFRMTYVHQSLKTADQLFFRSYPRIMGLCLLQNELCPINLNRHVIKHILSRRVSRIFHLKVLVYKCDTRVQITQSTLQHVHFFRVHNCLKDGSRKFLKGGKLVFLPCWQ